MRLFLYDIFSFLRRSPILLHRRITQPSRDKELRGLIAGKRVLVLGAGPSSHELKNIPDDILVFSCNTAPAMLLEKNLTPHTDLFIANEAAFVNYEGELEKLLKKISINFFLTRDPSYIKNINRGFNYKKLLLDRASGSKNNYYLKNLIAPLNQKDIQGNAELLTSTGMALLQYALFYDAKEIYLLGIDLNIEEEGHALISPKDTRYYLHRNADQNFLKWISNHYNNVYIAFKKTPLVGSFPYKELQ